jgi:hypothetical protein
MLDEQNDVQNEEPQGPAVAEANELFARTMASLNITWSGSNGDLRDPVPYDMTDAEVMQIAAEAIRAGSVPGIPADPNVDFEDFTVTRFNATPDVQVNRLFLAPKTPVG